MSARKKATARKPGGGVASAPPASADQECLRLEHSLRERVKELEQVGERLRVSEERFRLLARATTDAVWDWDLRTDEVWWNEGYETLFGRKRDQVEASSKSWIEFIHPDDLERVMGGIHAVIEGVETEWAAEYRFRHADGHYVQVSDRGMLIRDPAGRATRMVGGMTDLTERRQADARMRELEQQILRAQRMESIGTLAGGIAHDLNNLLSPITMGVGLLRRREQDPGSNVIIDSIERSARRGSNLVRQMLSFARGAEGARVPLQVRALVREVEQIVETTFPKSVRFETDLPADLWPVVGDPTQLNQVLLNLCVNARDAMPSGGLLQVSAGNLEADEHYATMQSGLAAGRYVLLTVTDTGTGIPPEILERIFDPFFTTKGVGKGTGLGLSSVLGIVRGHGGVVAVDSVIGRGSTFRVHLPAAQPDALTVDSADPFGGGVPRGSGELILLVDDEFPVLTIMRQTIEEFGYRAMTAEDGAQAVAMFATNRSEIALVVTDMMMPVMDGAALILALRRLDPRLGIIGVSGLADGGMAARAAEAGVTRVLRKPFAGHELLSAIHATLAERTGNGGTP